MVINKIKPISYVDGPGKRCVVWMQGCSIGCKGCQNKHLWDVKGGTVVDAEQLAITLTNMANPHGQITITGGEPFQQPRELAYLVRYLRQNGAKHIVVYSGYTYEQLTNTISGSWLWIMEILSNIDVLVDGPFIKALDHDKITYRGSSNQRVIDVPATIRSGHVVELDWNDEIQVTEAGEIVLPVGFAKELAPAEAETIARCGQAKRG